MIFRDHTRTNAGTKTPPAALALALARTDRVQHAEHLQPAAKPQRGRAREVDAGQDQRHAPGYLRVGPDPIGRRPARPRQQQGDLTLSFNSPV